MNVADVINLRRVVRWFLRCDRLRRPNFVTIALLAKRTCLLSHELGPGGHVRGPSRDPAVALVRWVEA